MEFRDEADGRRELHIAIGFATNSRFHYPETGLGIDGTGIKGRNCITVVADLAERNVVCVVPGKDAHTVGTVRAGFHEPQRRPEPGAPGDVRHEHGIRQEHPRAPAQRREGHRQVPRRQARQP